MEKNKLLTSAAEDTVAISRTEYENLLEDKRQKEWLLEQLRLAHRNKFGFTSEKATEEVYEQLSLMFDEPAACKQRGLPRVSAKGWLCRGYRSLEHVTHVGCWAHVRRKFNDAVEAAPKGKKSPTAVQGVAYCMQLFKIDETRKDLTPEKRQKKRLEEAKPVLDAMLAWANNRTAVPKLSFYYQVPDRFR